MTMRRVCDHCDKVIEEDDKHFTLTAGKNPVAIGPPLVLTPRGNRFYAGKVMMRIQASLYIGSMPDNTDEIHLHDKCISIPVYERLGRFLFQNTPEVVPDESR